MDGTALGRYRLHGRIGQGRAAVVYAATDIPVREAVAVKVVHVPDRCLVLERDLRVASRLQHPNLLPVYEHGTSNMGRAYLVTALAPGGTLREAMGRQALPVPRALAILRSLAAALDAAHDRGAVHRDVKPSNVLLGLWGEPRLADFGVARLSYGLVGTPGYVAPEQILRGPVGRQSDVYALAAIAFEMLCGSPPCACASPGETLMETVRGPVPVPSQRNPDLPPAVDRVFGRALAKALQHRHATAGEFAAELANAFSRRTETDGGPLRAAFA